MKNFIKDICYCGLLFVIVCLCMEFAIQYVDNEYSYKYKYLNKHSDDIEILLLGNSYFEDGINPHLFSAKTFDIAISARWIYFDKQIVEEYVPTMSNLKIVIFPIGYKYPFYHSYHYKNQYTNGRIIYRYAKFMRLWYDEFPKNYLYWFALPRGNMTLQEFTSSHKCDSIGYIPLYGQESKLGTIQNVAPDIIYVNDVEKQIAEYTMYLTDMAKVCSENNVRFIVVTPPCHETFNVNTRPEGIAAVHKIIEDVHANYPIEYKDYLFDEDFRADSLYFNCSHLNNIGADMFTKKVIEDFDL